MNSRAYSASESDASEGENTYCIFLHIVEGFGLLVRGGNGDCGGDRVKDTIVLHASLNGVKFEVEGHCTETVTIFNSNCIWECELADIKRMKKDNRPVKLECFLKASHAENVPKKIIGSLLLPMRSLQTISSTRDLNLKLHWHKLGTLSPEWRQLKPEIYSFLIIVKKTLVESGQLEGLLGQKKSLPYDLSPQASETALMLQSKSNIYVQLLEQAGMIQVGNNPDVDCDIFNVSLTFKQVKSLEHLLERERSSLHRQVFAFCYDFLGSASHVEIFINSSDCYAINEKISLSFKSSFKSLREYFQRIFYIPVNLYLNAALIASYQLDFSKLIPEDGYFNTQTQWTKTGSFNFDQLHKILSPKAAKPSVDFIFYMQHLQCFSKKHSSSLISSFSEATTAYECDNKAGGDFADFYCHTEFSQSLPAQSCSLANQNLPLSARILNNIELFKKNCTRTNSEPFLSTDMHSPGKSARTTETSESGTRPVVQITVGTGTEDLPKTQNLRYKSVSTETDSDDVPKPTTDVEDFTLKIVQELEEWKKQQMEHFVKELGHKEVHYLNELQQQWEDEQSELQRRLEERVAECEELNAKLECAHIELLASREQNRTNKEMTEAIRNDIQRSCSDKFKTLESEIKRLQTEMDQKGSIFEQQHREIQLENSRLEKERSELKAHIAEFEKHLIAVEKTNLSASELKNVLNEVRVQKQRFTVVEQSKNYYKEQWAKATKETHKLKLNLLQPKKTFSCGDHSGGNNLYMCLKKLISEKQSLKSDRSELQSIKEALLNVSETE